jgi:thioredoxin 1
LTASIEKPAFSPKESTMALPVTVTDTSFKEEVLDSSVPVLVDFWAAWCSPCKMIAPIVEELASQYDGQIKVAKVDVDANPITPGMFGVLSIPTLMLFRGGQAAERIVGYQPKQALEAKLQAALAA